MWQLDRRSRGQVAVLGFLDVGRTQARLTLTPGGFLQLQLGHVPPDLLRPLGAIGPVHHLGLAHPIGEALAGGVLHARRGRRLDRCDWSDVAVLGLQREVYGRLAQAHVIATDRVGPPAVSYTHLTLPTSDLV